MSKIKNWEKARDDNKLIIWQRIDNPNKKVVYSNQREQAGPKNNIFITGFGFPGINKDFKTKKQALNFAIRFMKKHPKRTKDEQKLIIIQVKKRMKRRIKRESNKKNPNSRKLFLLNRGLNTINRRIL